MEQVRKTGRDLGRAGQDPTVSVIMPAYNVSQFIGEAIESVLAQTFTDYEIVVVNDGSSDTDALEQVLAPYRDHIVYIRQENCGCSCARNTAIRAARGRYIALLDPDDLWEPNYLAVQLGILERDPTVDVVYPNALIFGDARDAGKTFMEICPSRGEVTFESLVDQTCAVMISVTARREAIQSAGMFDESLRSTEDFDLWLRIVHRGGRIVYHREPVVHYRRRPGSLSSDTAWMCRHVLQVLDKAERTMRLSPAEREAIQRQRRRTGALLRFYEGKKAFFRGDYRAAIENLAEANAFLRSGKISLALLLLRVAPQLLLHAYNLRERLAREVTTA